MVITSSVSFLFGISPTGHQYARSGNNENKVNTPRVVDVFYRKIDTKAILSHLVLIGLFPKSAKFVGSVGHGLTANPNS